jgi:hypothetical protein
LIFLSGLINRGDRDGSASSPQVSGSLPALQDQAQAAADAFCKRYVQPRSRKGRQCAGQSRSREASSHDLPAKIGKFYRRRDHEASPFFKVVRDYFDEFERVYPERYQKAYGYWRPVVRSSIDKFMKPVVSLSNHAVI